jgi:hypothetical protein
MGLFGTCDGEDADGTFCGRLGSRKRGREAVAYSRKAAERAGVLWNDYRHDHFHKPTMVAWLCESHLTAFKANTDEWLTLRCVDHPDRPGWGYGHWQVRPVGFKVACDECRAVQAAKNEALRALGAIEDAFDPGWGLPACTERGKCQRCRGYGTVAFKVPNKTCWCCNGSGYHPK